VLGDPTRVRLLALLSQQELSVGELAAVTQLAQPRISTHLARLRDADLVQAHRSGSASSYQITKHSWSPTTSALVAAVLQGGQDPLLAQDAARVDAVLAARQGQSSWADSVAGQMARHYSPGRTWEAVSRGLVGLARLGCVIDIASGDGALAELLAPHAQHIDCIDRSERVVAKARTRLAGVDNLTVHHADMHHLPFADCSFDHALMLSSLSYSAQPALALSEAARVLRPGGRLVAVTLHAHGHKSQVARYDHQNQGFAVTALTRLATTARLDVQLCDITSRERQAPQHQILTLHATKRAASLRTAD